MHGSGRCWFRQADLGNCVQQAETVKSLRLIIGADGLHGENGLIVPRQDGTALAGAIRRLYNDPETRLRMGGNALRIYEERFTAGIMAEGIEQVYREAMTINN